MCAFCMGAAARPAVVGELAPVPVTLEAMELTDLPQMDPRVLKATSVKADPTAPATAEPQAL